MPNTSKKFVNFLVFGASGHLAKNYIFPALENLKKDSHNFNLIGYARTPAAQVSLPSDVSYWSGSYDEKGLSILQGKLSGNTIFYFALPSQIELLGSILSSLKNLKLLKPDDRLIIEKPFGSDSKTAQKLLNLIISFIPASQVYPVDHYLTKDLVKNIISLRFANPIFQNSWNKKSISKIEINAFEDKGIEERGEYYDQSGALRDMVQNHCLQLLSLLTIKEPLDLNQASLHQEKLEVLNNLKLQNMTLGQYNGYLHEPHIKSNSKTETYAQLTFTLNLKGWSKVPIIITTGKKLKEKRTEMIITFHKPQLCLWGDQCTLLNPNQLIINLYPENEIRLTINTEFNPSQNLPQSHSLKLGYTDISTKFRSAYENVLLDVIAGIHLNTPSFQEILAQWKLVDTFMLKRAKARWIIY